MSLLDDLRKAATAVDPQFQVSTGEIQGVLSAAVHYLEHGDTFLQAVAAGVDEVTKLLAPPAPPAPPADSTPSADVVELQKQVSDLQAQLAARQATAQATQVVHETGVTG